MAEAEAEAPRSRFWMEHPAVGVVQRVDAELGWALRKARWPIKEGIALLYEIAWNGAGYVVGYEAGYEVGYEAGCEAGLVRGGMRGARRDGFQGGLRGGCHKL